MWVGGHFSLDLLALKHVVEVNFVSSRAAQLSLSDVGTFQDSRVSLITMVATIKL